MEPFITPFSPIPIATQKDNILKYLSYNSNPLSSEKVYDDLKLEGLPKEDFNEYLREMGEDGNVDFEEMSGNRKILFLTDKGKRFLRFGGYMKNLKNDLNKHLRKAVEEEKRQEKLDLEIKNLQASIVHYKRTRVISIWAIVISIISLVASVILKFIFK
jgi:predicted transcriptional regulator